MYIQSVELENVKSYSSAHVRFSEGVNAVVGHNGAGKSTLLEAIGFALFDAIQYKQSEFVREGAKTATVTVTFISSQDGRPYQVVRRVGGINQQYAYDPESQSKLCSGSADVAAFVRQHAGVDPTSDLERLFRDAVGVPQGTLTAAFLEQPSRRKPIFDPLLQVEEYQQAFAGLLDAKNLVRDRQQEVDKQIAGLASLVQQLPMAETQQAAAANEQAAAKDELAGLLAHFAQVRADRARLEEARQRLVAAETRCTNAQHKVETSVAQLQTARQALADAEKAQAAIDQNQSGHDRYIAAQARKQEIEGRLRKRQQTQNAFAALEKEAALHRNRIEQRQTELEAIAAAEKKIAALADAVELQSQLEVALATAREQFARLRDVEREMERTALALDQANKRRTATQVQLARSEAIEAELTADQARLATLRRQAESLIQQQATLQSEASAVKKQTEELENTEGARCPVCEQPLTPTHRAEMLARNGQRLQDLRAGYAKAHKESKTVAATIQEAEAKMKALQGELRSLPTKTALLDLEQTINDLTTALTETQGRMAELTGAPIRIAEVEKRLAALSDPRAQSQIARAEAQRRPATEKALTETQQLLLRCEQDAVTLARELAASATLDADLDVVNDEMAASAAAYQLVIAHRQAAAMLSQRRVAAVEAEEANATAQAARAEAQIAWEEASRAFDQPAYEAAMRAEQELAGRVGGLNAKLEMLQRQIDRLTDEIASLRIREAELAVAQAKRARLGELERTLDTLRNIIKQAGPYITRALIGQISEGAAQIFGDLMNDYARRLEWNEDYSITLDVDGRKRQFAQLSGGEQMSAALAVRLSLLREMSDIDVAFFDEPTSNLDSERRDALARQVLSVKGFRQLFVISHDDAFEQVTQNLIRVERVDGVSRVIDGG